MSMQALRERLASTNQAANAILAEKGAQTWSKDDQAKFDAHMDEAERIKSQIEAHQKALEASRETDFSDADDHHVTRNAKNGKKLTNEDGSHQRDVRDSVEGWIADTSEA